VDESSGPDLTAAAAVSPRWVEWRRRIDIDAYEERFARTVASGANAHGEADFITDLRPRSVLDAGCGTGRVAIELSRRGMDVIGVDLDADMIEAARRKAPQLTWIVDDLARMELDRRFDVVAMPGNVMIFCRPDDRQAIVRNLAQHLLPRGVLVAGFQLEPDGYSLAEWDIDCRAGGLELIDRFGTWERAPFVEGADYHVSVHRRTDRFTVHDLIAEARAGITRLTAAELALAIDEDPALLVVDTRQTSDRDAGGSIPGSVHIPRTVLEWRADAASAAHDRRFARLDQRIVVVCNEGYSSSLAAANLRRLGFVNATDLIGGYAAWVSGGYPIVND